MERGLATVEYSWEADIGPVMQRGLPAFPVPTGAHDRADSFSGGSMDFLLIDSIPRSDWWPVVKMADGTLRKGPYAEIVGRWK